LPLYDKSNYTADISYLTNVFIYEYDISKCNINVLHTAGVIDQETYDFLYGSPRMVRQKYVGNLCKDKSIYNTLHDGIIEAKRQFFEANALQDRDILSIKNDAVFVLNKRANNTKFGLIEFIKKNVYTSFYRLNGMEFYYYYSNATKEEYLDVKGISDTKLELHEQYFTLILKDLFYSIQINGPDITMRMLKDVYAEYVTLVLPVGYYRNFNAGSMFHSKFSSNMGTGYEFESVTEDRKKDIDISNNLKILMEIQQILVSMYFNRN
jgi:hypothetical protein